MFAGAVSNTLNRSTDCGREKMTCKPGNRGWGVVEEVAGLTYDDIAQHKEKGREITAVFTLCLTEVANWLPNASIPPPFKTKERQLLVVVAPFTLWL